MKILNVLTLPNNYTGNWACDLVGAKVIAPLNGQGALYYSSVGSLDVTIPVGDPTKAYSLSFDYDLSNRVVSSNWPVIKVDSDVVLAVPRNTVGVFKGEIVIDNVAEEYRVYPVVGDPVTFPMTTKVGIWILFNYPNSDIKSTTRNMIFSELEDGETRAGYIISEERTFESLSNDTSFHSTEVGTSNLEEINRLSPTGVTTLKTTSLVATVNGLMAQAKMNVNPDDDLFGVVVQAPAYRTEESRMSVLNLQFNDLDILSTTVPYSATVTIADPSIAILQKSDIDGGLTATTLADLQIKFGGGA